MQNTETDLAKNKFLDNKKDSEYEYLIDARSKAINTKRENTNFDWLTEHSRNFLAAGYVKKGVKPKIACLGLAFKPDIDDLRESPAKYITQKVLQNANNEEYYIVEPNITEHKVFKLTNHKEAVQKADIIVFLVAHKEFKALQLTENKVVLDFCGTKKIK